MARSLNRVQLIGNLTRDPELRYTPSGTAVCSFGLATNRAWKTDTGEKREEAEFHNIVAWNKLAELCSQFLVKGRKVFVEGRLATRNWNASDGTQRTRTEVIISDMILLDSRRAEGEAVNELPEAKEPKVYTAQEKKSKEKKEEGQGKDSKPSSSASKQVPQDENEEVEPSDIPF